MARRSVGLLLAMAICAAQAAMAQVATQLRPGDRLRVRVLDSPAVPGFRPQTTTYVGRLDALEAAWLMLSVADSLPPEAVAFEQVLEIERSLGRPMSAGAAWLIGAGLGGTVAWYSGIGIGGPAGLGLSVLVGGGVGLLFAREDWRPVAVPPTR